jgi:hypothetical protein
MDNYVYQLKSDRLGGSALEEYEPGDVIVGDDLDAKLTEVVEGELTFWGGWTSFERHLFPEVSAQNPIKTEKMAIAQPRLKEYYSNVGVTSTSPGQPAWSAAFVSYVITKVDPSFPKSGAHTLYAQGAKEGKGGWSLFMTNDPPAHGDKKSNAQIKANIGDVLIKPPTGGRLTGKDAKELYSHGDVVYKISGSTAWLAGGNLGNTAKVAYKIALTAGNGYYKGFAAYELIIKKKGRVIGPGGVVTTPTPTDADDAGGAAAQPAPPPAATDTAAPPAPPPGAVTAEMDAAWGGQPVSALGLEAMDCEQLWSLRNSVYARHGYAFSSARAQNYFVADSRYTRNENVNAGTIDSYLSATDRTNRDTIAAAEAVKSC